MKVEPNAWRQRAAFSVAGFAVVLAALSCARAASPLGNSERPEAYFNGSSYIRLAKPITLKQLVGLSYRTCVGGELFSQRNEGYTLHVTALFDQVVVSWQRPGAPPPAPREVALPRETLDNAWHWLALRYRPNPPALLLELDHETQVISNVTWNPELLAPGALEAGGAVALVGSVFSGCVREGPQLEFHPHRVLTATARFGPCPLSTDECKDRKDVLRIPPKDFCYNEPCLRHGTCISRHDRYECHCTARYTGNNCEVDAGSPCASRPCANGGRCEEDARGDYSCDCPPPFRGARCELQDSLDPLCVPNPCLHNGSCSVSGAGYACDCPPGFSGRDCEVDADECASAEAAGACLHGGRCVDGAGEFTCDCAGTGYTGPRCETNVDECEERGVCGHGVCYDTYGGFVCACQPDYIGERCQQKSACASSPCGLYGVCVEEDGGSGFRCVCARGLQPPLCLPPAPAPAPPAAAPASAPAAACADVVCPPHSHCRAGAPAAVTGMMVTKQVMCVCDLGYYGAPGSSPNCSLAEGACAGGVCLNGATCRAAPAPPGFECVCAPPYRGTYCELGGGGGTGGSGPAGKALSELRAERCAQQPCVHATACRDTPTGFRCECAAGWAGARCEMPEACVRGCNGGTCGAAGCECRPGFGGPDCERALDCRAAPCPPRQECVQEAGSWRCAAAAAESACASSPCHNGTCLALETGLFRCNCAPGYTGRLCEVDLDECVLTPKICNHGVCLNVPGTYECYCKPGYTGASCDQDIDECLSSPCKNGGTCQNLENNYECTCVNGFEGKDCSVNIDECASSPCAAGSTCVDGVGGYSCVCRGGLTGARCETDIDDCESAPCLHGGRCRDRLDGYTCACAGTGYEGAQCEIDVDECASHPCRNGGTCLDDVADYRCACHPAYTGKSCETDVEECESSPCKYGGVCLERSNASLYVAVDAGPVRVGPQPQQLLPAAYYAPFDPAAAAGFDCVCVRGTAGARCELNVDECASAPCRHGKCVDGVGGYECVCAAGFEGEHCETEIDECERYEPCVRGRCVDARATYLCECEAGWGGRNCSVELAGCRGEPCRNGGTCLPWLRAETEHRFNCSCAPGHYGTTCDKITTMSLERSSFAEVNTSREEGYDISFRFKTTLGSALLAMGRGLTYFFLELSNGRLNLHSSLLNKWEGVFIGSNLNDSRWQKVFVTINASHLVLAANEEQTIYPISQNEAYTAPVTSFPSTRLGTAGSSFATLTHGPNFFVGCFQDVVVNGQWVLPEDSNATAMTERADGGSGGSGASAETGEDEEEAGAAGAAGGARTLLHGVLASCPRKPQCSPNPCQSGGACEDAWTSFVCTCPRPYLGDTCQYNYTAATFGHEGSPRGAVAVAVAEAARRSVRAALDVSMFVRTRKPTGQIFWLGGAGRDDDTAVGAALAGGELTLHLRFNQTPEDYTVGGTRLDNGYPHLIQVVRNSTLVQVKLNGTEYFRKPISAAKQLDAQVLYLGGPPPSEPPAPPSAPPAQGAAPPATTTPPPVDDDADYFKGVIQDVQISNGVNVSVVEFFPLQAAGAAGLRVPPQFGAVTLGPGVLAGVVSDDACASAPCLHAAACRVTWNDYVCDCPRGYKGKTCAEVEFCQLQGCPLNSHCRNLDRGYECVSNATFDGANTTLRYVLRAPLTAADAPPPPTSLTITYRTKVGGTLFRAESAAAEGADGAEGEVEGEGEGEGWWFSVGVYRGVAALRWRLRALPELRRLRVRRDSTDWTTLRLTVADGRLTAAFVDGDGREEVGLTEEFDVPAWQHLVTAGVLTLGGGRPAAPAPAHTTPLPMPWENSTEPVFEYSEADELLDDNPSGEYFKGCMGAVHVGGLLLPYFTEEQLFVGAAAALLAAQPHYALAAGAPWGAAENVGCVLCLEHECERGARCEDVRASYACACPPGFAGDRCQRDVDECLAHECRHGATCRDGVNSYTCECPAGYDGRLCERDVDECESAPCLNGGSCEDGPGRFVCACPDGWHGARCELPARPTCAHRPCAADAECRDVPDPASGNNYTCVCGPSRTGVHCELAFCEVAACVHGECNRAAAACACEEGWGGRRCEVQRDACGEAGPAPCEHGGSCVARGAGYDCACPTGWHGARCQTDVDECAAGAVCGPGACVNTPGSYICECQEGWCGAGCALPDPCAADSTPCDNGGACRPRCTDVPDYECECADGWDGRNCTAAAAVGGALRTRVLLGAGAALLLLALGGAALGALAAQARRKRATRGTYSPSGQEYCNPRAEMMHNALKPPPEERLI
ncbi:protein crumbs [Aricia agestis]|uniref:protein crumbs n=1 Tax=Aricia agestis TaxID=91739 RepID=UPI001C205337|nr:protein crumbs [Aricia agestis]